MATGGCLYHYSFEQPLFAHTSQAICPAASEDAESTMSDVTDLVATDLSRSCHRTRKQQHPMRAPMYSNTGAVPATSPQHHQHHATSDQRPSRLTKQQHSSGTAAVSSRGHRALHGAAAAAARSSKKNNPCTGPCDNCGTTNSPQWRHGSKSKPIVCNACGIRYLRTGSFDKAVDNKRAGALSSGSIGARQPKRSRPEAEAASMEEDEEDQATVPHIAASQAGPTRSDGGQSCVNSRAAAAEPATTSGRTATPPLEQTWGEMQAIAAANAAMVAAANGGMPQAELAGGTSCRSQQQSQVPQLPGTYSTSPCMSPMMSPASTSSAYNPSSAQPSPLLLGAPALNSNGYSRVVTSGSLSAPPQQQQQRSGRAAGTAAAAVGRLGPSPLSLASNGQAANRPSRFAAPAATTAPAVNGFAAGSANGVAASYAADSLEDNLVGSSGVWQQTAAGAAGPVHPAPVAAEPTAAAVQVSQGGGISPELIQMVQRLAGVLGSVEAAIAFIKDLSSNKAGAGAAFGAAGAGTACAGAVAGEPATMVSTAPLK